MTSGEDEKTRSRIAFVADAAAVHTRFVALWPGGHTEGALPDEGSVTFGRGLDCDVRLGSAAVSRRHAQLERRNGITTICDLGSAHGVTINGRRLASGEMAAVTAGSSITLGDAVLVLQEPQELAGAAPALPNTQALTALVAKSNLNVILAGETGSGKEVLARKLHDESPRADKPFVRINCAAFPESTVDAELFGFEKGAFTGAAAAKPGLIESAQGGTLLLDEVADLPLGTQAKLLRAVGNLEVLRLGSVTPKTINVRFIAASHANLQEQVAQGRFRSDLWFRLNGITLTVPPLRERREEIAPLAAAFVADVARDTTRALRLDATAVTALMAHAWPGNIRELKTTIERACALCTTDVLTAHEVTAAFRLAGQTIMSPIEARPLADDVAATERRRIEEALASCQGNQTRAAALLGISRRSLIYRLEQYGFARPRK